MSKKIIEFVNTKLDPEDQVQKAYRAKYYNTDGWFVMSKRKLLFIDEKGLLRTTYSLVKEILYETIDKIDFKRNQLALTEFGDIKHVFTSSYMSAIENNLKILIDSVFPKAIA